MAFCQTSLMFSDHGKRDWSEIFFDEQNSAELGAILTQDEQDKIMRCRAVGVTLKAVRCAEVSGLRRVGLKTYKAINRQPFIGSAGRPDVPGVSVKYHLTFAEHGGRTLSIRGLPDDGIFRLLGTGDDRIEIALEERINEYLGFIKDNFRGQRLKSADVQPWTFVVSLKKSILNPNWTEVTHIAKAGVNLDTGDDVYFRFLDKDQFPYIQGTFTIVQKIDTTHFLIPVRWRHALAEAFCTSTEVREVQYDYPQITAATFLHHGTRDTGGPTARHRGRQKGRFSRQ